MSSGVALGSETWTTASQIKEKLLFRESKRGLARPMAKARPHRVV